MTDHPDQAANRSDATLSARLARRAAARAAERDGFMAWVLARYRETERLDDDGLAAFLGIDRAALDRLALCGRPRPELFGADVAAIAEHAGASEYRLANLIRQVEALQALARAPAEGVGLLAAARSYAAEDAAAYETTTSEGQAADEESEGNAAGSSPDSAT